MTDDRTLQAHILVPTVRGTPASIATRGRPLTQNAGLVGSASWRIEQIAYKAWIRRAPATPVFLGQQLPARLSATLHFGASGDQHRTGRFFLMPTSAGSDRHIAALTDVGDLLCRPLRA